MYNKYLFNKICDVNCSLLELKKFVTNIDKQDFDLDNPFDKFYSIDKIILAIDKYQSKEVNADFLSCWMVAYNWIIMDGFQIIEDSKTITLRDFIIWTISDWLDSLSFFNDEIYYDLEKYKRAFYSLDYILHNLQNSNAVFAQEGFNDDEVVVLVTNDILEFYALVYGNLNCVNNQIKMEKVELKDLKNLAKKAQKFGYKEISYNFCNEK